VTDDGRRETGPDPQRIGPGYSFRARLTAGLIAGAVVPLAGFGLVLVAAELARTGGFDSTLSGLVVFALAAAIIVAVVFAYFLAGNLTQPLRAIAHVVERSVGGDLSARVGSPARMSSPASSRATTDWPPTSPAATPSSAGSSWRSGRRHPVTAWSCSSPAPP
jgi:HAMP domain-containing protein